MAQIGVGAGSSYPQGIDTRQVWENAPVAAPDSNRRLDAEAINDLATAIVQIEHALGSNPQGVYGSVAARLNALLGGSGGSTGVYTFTDVPTFTIPGNLHNVGQGALVYKIYDAQIPAHVMEAGTYSVAVSQSTYDVELTFTPARSGYIAIGATSPFYIRTFTGQTTVTILGTIHQLGTSDITFKVFDAADPANEIQIGGLTVHQTTHDVVLTFVSPTSGFIILSAGGPTYGQNFTNTQIVTIPGGVHQLGTRGILFDVYDNATPRNHMADPATTVHPNTFDIVMDFGTQLSGRIVLQPATTLTGRDFRITDVGVVGQSAVQVTSSSGNLYLVAGGGNQIFFADKTTASRLTLDVATAGNTWLTTSGNLHLAAHEFEIKDGGITGQTATRVATLNGDLYLQSGSGQRIFLADSLGNLTAVFYTNVGALGLGTTTPVYQLHLTQNSAAKPASPDWIVVSDTRVKEDLRPFVEGLDLLLQLHPTWYRYNGKGGIAPSTEDHVGFSAQDLQRLAPYMVRTFRGRLTPDDPETDLLAVDGNALRYLLLNSVKELHGMVIPLQQEVATLHDQVTQLLQRVAVLEMPGEGAAQEGQP